MNLLSRMPIWFLCLLLPLQSFGPAAPGWIGELTGEFNYGNSKIVLGPDGAVYVAANRLNVPKDDIVLVKYAAETGAMEWQVVVQPGLHIQLGGLAVDASGVLVGGASTQRHSVAKYDFSGNSVWQFTEKLPVAPPAQTVGALLVDSSDHILFESGVVLVKLDATGTKLWTVNTPDFRRLALGKKDQIYWSSWYDVTALDPAGAQEWKMPVPFVFNIVDLCVDAIGRPWVAGTYDNGAVAVFSESGTLALQRTFVGTRYRPEFVNGDRLTQVQALPEGGVLVAGEYADRSRFTMQAIVMRLDTNAHRIWTASLPPNHEMEVMARGPQGQTVLAGRLRSPDQNRPTAIMTAVYDSGGALLFEAAYQGATNFVHDASGIVVDPSGNVYVTGMYYRPGVSWNVVTLKYPPPDTRGPKLVQAPTGKFLPEGTSTELNVQAEGPLPLEYQWFRDQRPMPGETNATLTLNPAATGAYSVGITNAFGQAHSPDAIVLAVAGAQQTTEPGLETTVVQGVGQFTSSSGSVDIEVDFQWQKNGLLLPGDPSPTADTLTLTNVTPADVGQYSAIAISPFGALTNTPGRLEVFDRVARAWEAPMPPVTNGLIQWTSVQRGAQGNLYVFANYSVSSYAPTGERLWTRYNAGMGGRVDLAGNLYALSRTNDPSSQDDILINKIDSSGTILWSATYGTKDANESVTSLAVDLENNLLVVGSSSRPFLIKLSSQGQLLWTNLFSGGTVPIAVATDAEGNSYVAVQEGSRALVFKYSALGELVWRVDSTSWNAGWNELDGLVVNPDGSSYAVGRRSGVRGSTETYAQKLNANGGLLWSESFDAGGAAPVAVQVGPDTSLYVVAGYVLARLSTNGHLDWASHFEAQSANLDYVPSVHGLAVDALGNAFLTADNQTLKVGPDGTLLWVDNTMGGQSITLGDGADVYVVNPANLVKYSPTTADTDLTLPARAQDQIVGVGQSATLSVSLPAGVPLQVQWVRGDTPLTGQTNGVLHLEGVSEADSGLYTAEIMEGTRLVGRTEAVLTVTAVPAIQTQPQDQSQVSGGAVTFSVTASAAGPITYQWLHNGDPIANTLDSSLTLTGLQSSDAGLYQVRLSSAAGSVISEAARLRIYSEVVESTFAHVPTSDPSADAEGQEITLDNEGNIYVAGNEGSYGQVSINAWKFDPAGSNLWQRILDGPSGNREATGIAWDTAGQLFVTGTMISGLVSLSADGEVSLLRNLPAGFSGQAIAVDSQGNPAITGVLQGKGGGCMTARFGADRQLLWSRVETNDSGGRFILCSSSGETWVGGSGGAYHYAQNGAPLWEVHDLQNCGVALDAAENVLIAGGFTESDGRSLYLVRKYTSAGMPVWETVLSVTSDQFEPVMSLLFDAAGDLVVVGPGLHKLNQSGYVLWGHSQPGYVGGVVSATGDVFVTRPSYVERYDTAGHLAWAAKPDAFLGSRLGLRFQNPLALGSDGSLYVPAQRASDLMVLKYTPKAAP